MKKEILFFLMVIGYTVIGYGQNNPDAILGKWMSTEGNLEVEVFKDAGQFKAKVLWFDDSDDKSKPMSSRTDENNPNKELRNRRIIGMEVLTGLHYDADEDEWIDGVIYDSKAGKEWDSKAWINKSNQLKVRGYWMVSLFGETMTFKKV